MKEQNESDSCEGSGSHTSYSPQKRTSWPQTGCVLINFRLIHTRPSVKIEKCWSNIPPGSLYISLYIYPQKPCEAFPKYHTFYHRTHFTHMYNAKWTPKSFDIHNLVLHIINICFYDRSTLVSCKKRKCYDGETSCNFRLELRKRHINTLEACWPAYF